jgi:hypothetical protein
LPKKKLLPEKSCWSAAGTDSFFAKEVCNFGKEACFAAILIGEAAKEACNAAKEC